jgi:Bcr/CflA subfamily drug resistance transporter
MDIYGPAIPNLSQNFTGGLPLVQYTVSSYVLSLGLGQLIFGPIADFYGRRKTILGSVALFMFGSIFAWRAPNIYWLIIARAIQGLAAAGTTVTSFAIIRDMYSYSRRARAYSLINFYASWMPLVSPTVGGLIIIHTRNWRNIFLLLIFFSLITFIVIYKKLKETNKSKNNLNWLHILRKYYLVYSSTYFLRYLATGITSLATFFTFFSIAPIVIIEQLGVREDKFGLYFGINGLVYLISNKAAIKIINKVGPNQTIRIGQIITFIGAGIMLLFAKYSKLSVFSLIFPNSIISFGVGLTLGSSLSCALEPFKHVAGIASAAYGAGQSLGAVFIGTYVIFHYGPSIHTLSITVLSMVLLSMLILPTKNTCKKV